MLIKCDYFFHYFHQPYNYYIILLYYHVRQTMKFYKPPNSRLVTDEYRTNHDATSSRSLDPYLTSAHLPCSLFQPMCLLPSAKVIDLKIHNRHTPPKQVKIEHVNISPLTFSRASPLHKFQVNAIAR